jgi:hypothetical protein
LLAFFDTLLAQLEAAHRVSPAGPGQPAHLSLRHLWVAYLAGVLRGVDSVADVWRIIVWEQLVGHAALSLTYMAVRQRLLRLGTAPFAQLFVALSALLFARQPSTGCELAPFAREVVVLDETTLERVRQLTSDLREEPAESDQLLVGKLAGLFDVRRQLWRRLEFRHDALANCKANVLRLLEGLPPGSLILADLGYFSFAWFDYLTHQGYYWLSRLRQGTSFELVRVLYQDGETLDALIWLGAYRADRAACLVRLVQFRRGLHLHQYLTNVLDPAQLSLEEMVRLYARRWDIELAFKALKGLCGLHLWWSAVPTLVLQQLWMALLLFQLLQAIRLAVATQAQVDPDDVSLDILAKLLAQPSSQAAPLIPLLVERGLALKLIRPARRRPLRVPALLPENWQPFPQVVPPPRHARYAQRKCKPPSIRLTRPPRFSSQLLL